MLTPNIVDATRFFQANAGYLAGGRLKGALDMARAEAWAKEQGLVFLWNQDPDADFSFVETWSKPDQIRFQRSEHYAESCVLLRPCAIHGALCQHSETLASLGGIVDADPPYRRVVEGELALEAYQARLSPRQQR